MRKATAIITGASSGIGRALSVHLGVSGLYRVALVARNLPELEKTESLVKDACADRGMDESDACRIFQCDVSDPKGLAKTIEEIGTDYAPIHVLINNAGIATSGTLDEVELEEWDSMLDVNVRAVVHGTRHCLPFLKQSAAIRHGGLRGDPLLINENESGIAPIAIVNIGSNAGTERGVGVQKSIYAATKAAVRQFSQCLFDDIQDTGIKVSCISPEVTNTPIIGKIERSRHLQADSDWLISTDDICRTVDYVLHSSASACPVDIVIRTQYCLR